MKFGLICADPPWAFGDKLTMSDVARGSESNYAVLSVDEIAAIPVKDWAEDRALLALWVPESMLKDGLRVMEAWGFEHKQIFHWIKTTNPKPGLGKKSEPKLHFGMGHLFRASTEIALIGKRGKNVKPVNKSQRNVATSPLLFHSAKPDTLQERLEMMFPEAAKLEMFARRRRPGWVCTGLKVDGCDIRKWKPPETGPVGPLEVPVDATKEAQEAAAGSSPLPQGDEGVRGE